MPNENDEILAVLRRMETHLDNLHNIQKNQPVKKLFFRWLVALYPVIVVILLITMDIDHKKFIEVVSDVVELTKDTHSLVYASNDDVS